MSREEKASAPPQATADLPVSGLPARLPAADSVTARSLPPVTPPVVDLTAAPAPVARDPLVRDTVAKKGRGVRGLSDNDYRIKPRNGQ